MAGPPVSVQRLNLILTGKARLPSAVVIVVIAVAMTRRTPAWRIAASRFLRTLRLSRTTSVRESPAVDPQPLGRADPLAREPQHRPRPARLLAADPEPQAAPDHVAHVLRLRRPDPRARRLAPCTRRPAAAATLRWREPVVPVTVITTSRCRSARPDRAPSPSPCRCPAAVYVCGMSSPTARSPSPKSHTRREPIAVRIRATDVNRTCSGAAPDRGVAPRPHARRRVARRVLDRRRPPRRCRTRRRRRSPSRSPCRCPARR